MRNHLTKPKTE